MKTKTTSTSLPKILAAVLGGARRSARASSVRTPAKRARSAAFHRPSQPILSVALAAALLLGGGAAPSRADILYVTLNNNTIEKLTSAGSGSVFASGAALNSPYGLAFDSAANLYAANLGNNTIEKFTPGGVGSVFANSTGLSGPGGLAFDSAGNLYAANFSANTIEKFSSTGTDLGVFADSTNGISNPRYLAFTNDAGVPLPLVNQAPEPASVALLALGGLGLLAARRPRAAARKSSI